MRLTSADWWAASVRSAAPTTPAPVAAPNSCGRPACTAEAEERRSGTLPQVTPSTAPTHIVPLRLL
ncbi:hypothetical protein ACWCXE_14035 [Streptomyces sp. NPDC001780]